MSEPGSSGLNHRERLFSWLGLRPVPAAEIRAEIWRLGGRHLGEPLEGALAELQHEDITSDRVRLLKACIRKLRAA